MTSEGSAVVWKKTPQRAPENPAERWEGFLGALMWPRCTGEEAATGGEAGESSRETSETPLRKICSRSARLTTTTWVQVPRGRRREEERRVSASSCCTEHSRQREGDSEMVHGCRWKTERWRVSLGASGERRIHSRTE